MIKCPFRFDLGLLSHWKTRSCGSCNHELAAALRPERGDVGGRCHLSGRTSTYYLKQLATHAALDLAGQFSGLTNEIAVG